MTAKIERKQVKDFFRDTPTDYNASSQIAKMICVSRNGDAFCQHARSEFTDIARFGRQSSKSLESVWEGDPTIALHPTFFIAHENNSLQSAIKKLRRDGSSPITQTALIHPIDDFNFVDWQTPSDILIARWIYRLIASFDKL